ncbi:Proliferating cell nuclear antigen [Spatholobus suberectus]|nr:Proliferating cell nuclear antigen [Spatholobus suberectus]
MFESPKQDKISDFAMKLMDKDSEHLGIPAEAYQAIVKMPSAEFSRICRDLASIGDTVTISVTKDGAKFSTKGDIGTANIVCKQNTYVDKVTCSLPSSCVLRPLQCLEFDILAANSFILMGIYAMHAA